MNLRSALPLAFLAAVSFDTSAAQITIPGLACKPTDQTFNTNWQTGTDGAFRNKNLSLAIDVTCPIELRNEFAPVPPATSNAVGLSASVVVYQANSNAPISCQIRSTTNSTNGEVVTAYNGNFVNSGTGTGLKTIVSWPAVVIATATNSSQAYVACTLPSAVSSLNYSYIKQVTISW